MLYVVNVVSIYFVNKVRAVNYSTKPSFDKKIWSNYLLKNSYLFIVDRFIIYI